MNWSQYQTDIFDFVRNGDGNATIEACPGSGKTTIIEASIKLIPPDKTVLAMAFNRGIRDELAVRLESCPNVDVHTLNSFGNSLFKGRFSKYKISNILRKVCVKDYYRLLKPVTKLMSLAKGNMIFEFHTDKIEDLAEEYGIDLPNFKIFKEVFELDQESRVFDFDDQIAMPLRKSLKIPKYDYVFIDEAQDLNLAKIALATKVGGRSFWVGDRNQAIYHFAGAAYGAMDRLPGARFPLSITYRCAKSIVKRAAQVFPGIQAASGATEGIEATISEDEFHKTVTARDVVLCRTNVPLVKECLRLIRQGKRAVVKGREISNSLVSLIKQIGITDLKQWYNNEKKKQDEFDTLWYLSQQFDTVEEIIGFLDCIFTNEEYDCITLMTIHKAKGLERDRVFILRPELLPHKFAKTENELLAEKCLEYVAITRAKKELYWVKTS